MTAHPRNPTNPLWAPVLRWIRQSFPDVHQISVEELARNLEGDHNRETVLVDVRRAEEYAVSHITGAERFDEHMEDAELAQRWPPDTQIVVYCSIGYRSSALARRLASLGYENVSNLEGSLFLWAAAGHRIERQGEVARHVHPYSRLWAYLLPRRLRAGIK